MTQFTRSRDANVSGTHFHGTVRVPPAALVDRFGRPDEADGYKVSMEFVFVSPDGDVVTLYDWKATSLYGGTRTTPRMLRAQTRPFEFHVGGHRDAPTAAFIAWLKTEFGLE